jgi:DNA-binding NarL/FixJ family response regulator
MSESPQARNDRLPRTRKPGVGGLPALLDAKQWSYLCRRYELTPREQQIAELVCQGLRNGKIATHLKIQPGTVKTHVRNIYRKVKVKNKISMLLRFVAEARDLSGGHERTGAAQWTQ